MGRPLDDATSDVLNRIFDSLDGVADFAGVVSLYTLDDSDFAASALRYFSAWSLDSIPSVRLFGPDVCVWCLSAITDPLSPSFSNGGPTALDSRDDMDEDEQSEQHSRDDTDEDHRYAPHLLRPVARLLAAVDPALADRFMQRFASATLFAIPFGDENDECDIETCVWLSGETRIAGSVGGVVRIWDIAAHATVHELIGHTDLITCLAASPNRSILASCSCDKSVRLWDVETGRAIDTLMLEHAKYLNCVAFSPDGLCIASGDQVGTIHVWSITTQTDPLSPLIGHEVAVSAVAYSSDGSCIVSGSDDGSIRLWDASTGDCTRVIRPGTGGILSVVFSPDSSRIVSGSVGALHIWNAVTGDEVSNLVVEGVSAVAYSPNGSRIASASTPHRGTGSKVRIWDAASGSLITEPLVLGEYDSIPSLQFSLDGSCLLSSTTDDIVRILDATEDWKRWDI